MKKFVAYKVVLIYCLFALFFFFIAFLCFDNESYYFEELAGYISIVLACCFCLVSVFFPNSITISEDKIIVINHPILATNRIYQNNETLISRNNSVNIEEIDKIDIVKLSKSDKERYIGFNHIFNKYIRISIKHSKTAHYIYASIYTKKQIQKVIAEIEKIEMIGEV